MFFPSIFWRIMGWRFFFNIIDLWNCDLLLNVFHCFLLCSNFCLFLLCLSKTNWRIIVYKHHEYWFYFFIYWKHSALVIPVSSILCGTTVNKFQLLCLKLKSKESWIKKSQRNIFEVLLSMHPYLRFSCCQSIRCNGIFEIITSQSRDYEALQISARACTLLQNEMFSVIDRAPVLSHHLIKEMQGWGFRCECNDK